jgi:hypothetical protein
LLLALYAAAYYSIEARKLPFAVLGTRRTILKNGSWVQKEKDKLQILQQAHDGKTTMKGSIDKHTTASLQLRGGALGLTKIFGNWPPFILLAYNALMLPYLLLEPSFNDVLGTSVALLLPYLIYTVYDPLGGGNPSALPRVEKACQLLWQVGFVGFFMIGLEDLLNTKCKKPNWSEAPKALFAIAFYLREFDYPNKLLHSSTSVSMVFLWLVSRIARGASPYLTDQELKAFNIIKFVPMALMFAAPLITKLKSKQLDQ